VKLPNGNQAVVEERKLVDYVLNLNHPTGQHHAVLFRDLLDITAANWTELRDALVRAAWTEDVTLGKSSPHGQKFEMRFDMTGPGGPKTVLAVWLIETGETAPRLITCFVE
jgi:hypothetical protein